MAKNLKKKTKVLGWCLAGALIVAGASAVALIDVETNFITKLFEEEKISEGYYLVDLSSLVSETTSSKETLKQEVKINDETSPFEKIELNYQLYGSEKNPATISLLENTSALQFDYVSEIEVKFELKEDVNFYVSNLTLLAAYVDKNGNPVIDDRLDIEVKVGNKKLDSYTSALNHVFMADNAVSGDITITFKNVLAEDGKTASFAIGGMTFNAFDRDVWTPTSEEVEEETDENTSEE